VEITLAFVLIVFLLVVTIGTPRVSSRPAAIRAVGVFLLTFALLAPILCVGQEDGVSTTRCRGLIPIPLPGYEGGGSFSPSFASPLAAPTVLALTYLYVVRRRRSS
jgi:hypothetical protein